MANNLSESVPERTFQYQSSLPPLPVPSLETSLSTYLEAGRIFEFCVIICQLNHIFVNQTDIWTLSCVSFIVIFHCQEGIMIYHTYRYI